MVHINANLEKLEIIDDNERGKSLSYSLVPSSQFIKNLSKTFVEINSVQALCSVLGAVNETDSPFVYNCKISLTDTTFY